jgi:hypothetical protein
MLSRLKPGGRRPAGSSGSLTGGRSGRAGAASHGGSKPKPGSLLGRASRTAGRAGRAVGSKLFGIRRPTAPAGTGGSSKPKGKGRTPAGGSGNGSTLELGVVWTGVGKAGRLLGRGLGGLVGRFRNRKHTDEDTDDFDPDSTYEIGIEGEVVNGKHTDSELAEIAKQAKKLAKKRAKSAPVWPNVDLDTLPPPPAPTPPPTPQNWPDYDVDDYAPTPEQPPKQSLPAERDHDPPPSPPVSPTPHREAPRITSTNGGKTMAVSPTKYNDLITTATSRTQGWQAAADAFRRDATELDEKAKEHDNAAAVFEQAGNHAAAEERRDEARQLRDDANTCLTYAGRMQEKANNEVSAA